MIKFISIDEKYRIVSCHTIYFEFGKPQDKIPIRLGFRVLDSFTMRRIFITQSMYIKVGSWEESEVAGFFVFS